MSNTLDEILAIGVPYMNDEWAQYPHEAQHMLEGFYSTDGFKEAKQLLLAEVLDMIGENEIEYSNLNGDAGYWEVHGRNILKNELRKLAQERFK